MHVIGDLVAFANARKYSKQKIADAMHKDVTVVKKQLTETRGNLTLNTAYEYAEALGGVVCFMSDEEYESGVSSEDENEADWNDMRIVDISGGGLKLYYSKHIDLNEVVKVRFVLPIERDVYRLNLTGRILRSTILEGRSDVYDTRVEFLNINPAERDKIVKYIFESERMNRAKETGLN